MTDWTGGYITDVEYTRSFHRQQAPANLDLACLLTGNAPPESPGKASYCDLGCGPGYTTALFAAANPDIDFWGIDFNPAHIADGRAFQAEIGLSNLHLCEHAFSDLIGSSAPDFPQFDYIALHGVFSWIAPDERAAIVRFLATHLKPGGLVYIGYNTLPRWADELAFQRILATYGRSSHERSDRAIEGAIGFVKRMREAGAIELDRPAVIEKLDAMVAEGRQRYLAHEYLNEHWTPMFHADVARDLAAAKLDYVGSAALLENFAQLDLTPGQRALCAEVNGLGVFETLKDFFLRRSFRRDVFARGKRQLSPAQQAARLRAIALDLLIPLPEVALEFNAPAGKAQLNEAIYRPMFDELGRGSATVGALLDLAAVKATTVTPVELVGMLVGTFQVIPRVHDAEGAARHTALAFNAAVARRIVEDGDAHAAFVARTTGSGVYLSQLQAHVYTHLTSGIEASTDALAAALARDFARRGSKMSAGGKPVETAEEMLVVLRRELTPMLADWVPVWRRLGVL